MGNRNLIIVMANERSIHSNWLKSRTSLSDWDLAIINYGNGCHHGTISLDQYLAAPTFKWKMMNQLLDSDFPFSQYSYIWLVDDDIDMNSAEIDHFFELCNKHEPALAQPSLSWGSHVTHPVTLHHPGFTMRKTTFVEIMAPCFSKDSWSKLKHAERFDTFTGWGLELFWVHVLNPLLAPFFIFDQVAVKHTRPLGLGKYAWLPEGHEPSQYMFQEIERLKLNRALGWFRCNLELIEQDGTRILFSDEGFLDTLARSVALSFRRASYDVAGISLLKLSRYIHSDLVRTFNEIPHHAAFGEYLLNQIYLEEWVSELHRLFETGR